MTQASSETEALTAAPEAIARAAELLTAGQLVAFPTETVYGLGADATNGAAVAAIYATKGRPSFNPLIAHVADVRAARRLVQWNDWAEAMATALWPGPLTLVLPLRPDHNVSPLVTAGLDTLAVRVPAKACARELLAAVGRPVAAPSANPSGRISPTTADHVRAGLGGKIAAILDDGPCGVGVESTILGLAGAAPILLRPGGLAAEDIQNALGCTLRTRAEADPLTAPGQLMSHYAPNASVRLEAQDFSPNEVSLGFGPGDFDLNLSPSGDLNEAAANLFGHLHHLDALGRPIAVAPVPERGLGIAINDRLRRAAAPRDS